MTKELEALEYIGKNYEYIDKHQRPNLLNIADEYNIIKKALTPPTSEEVCEALREWFKKQKIDDDGIKYDKKYKAFVNGSFILVNYIDDMLLFEVLLPSQLLIMLGKFYEGVVENG